MRQTLYRNGIILTMEGEEPELAEAVLVEGGIIWATGDEDILRRDLHRDAGEFDLQGAVMLPGLIETEGDCGWSEEIGIRLQLVAFLRMLKAASAAGVTTIQYKRVTERELLLIRFAGMLRRLPVDIVCTLSHMICHKYFPTQYLMRDQYFMHIRSCMSAENEEKPEEAEKAEQAERLEQAERPEEAEKAEQAERSEEAEIRKNAQHQAEEYSPYEFLRQHTIQGAQRIHEEEHKGSIRAGKEADFVILDQNPLEQTGKHSSFRLNKKWLTEQVLATIQQDVVVYRKK